jgi:hypothetical protein
LSARYRDCLTGTYEKEQTTNSEQSFFHVVTCLHCCGFALTQSDKNCAEYNFIFVTHLYRKGRAAQKALPLHYLRLLLINSAAGPGAAVPAAG